jgi:hypothetical protein
MVTIVLCAFVRLEISLCFAFFADFKRDSPGCLGDPYGCPRHQLLTMSIVVVILLCYFTS